MATTIATRRVPEGPYTGAGGWEFACPVCGQWHGFYGSERSAQLSGEARRDLGCRNGLLALPWEQHPDRPAFRGGWNPYTSPD